MSVSELPPEIWFQILGCLHILDLLRFRQACHQFLQLTRDKSVWLNHLDHLRNAIALPPFDVQFISPLDLESLAVRAHKTSRSWTKFRRSPPFQLNNRGGRLLGLNVFDHWLLVVHDEGLVYLWDLDDLSRPKASLELDATRWSSYSADFNPISGHIVVALTKSFGITTTRLFRFQLTADSDIIPQPIHNIRSSDSLSIQCVDFSSRRAIFSRTGTPQLCTWEGEDSESKWAELADTADIPAGDEMWNGIIVTRFAGPILIVLKARSAEVYYSLPSVISEKEPELHTPCIRHPLPHAAFRDICISDCRTSRSGEQTIVSFTFCGFEILQGIFHYYARFSICGDGPPQLDIHLLSIYPLVKEIRSVGVVPIKASPETGPIGSSQRRGRSALDTLRDTNLSARDLNGVAATQTNQSKGFISAFALGCTGKRAVWIERKRGSILREVLVWGHPIPPAHDHCFLNTSIAVWEDRVVYRIQSLDLRDDITHCALDEVSGKIVLGSRAGNVSILDIGDM